MAFSVHNIVKKHKATKDCPALMSYMVDRDDPVEFLSTNVISLNLLFSGRVHGGIPKGKMSMISAPSMLGKSFVAMGLVKNAQKEGMQVVVIDTERSFSFELAKGLKIDTSPEKLVVLQENSIEEVKSIILHISEEIPKAERKNVLYVIDSWGSLVTSKAISDGLKGNDVVDMTQAQKKNTLANIILNTQSTFFIVNHVYDNVGGFGDPMKIPGGRKVVFNCDSIVLGMSRAKDKNKTTKEVIGHIITAETFKSRHSKEKSKLKFRIKHTGGLDIFYGLLDDALEGGFVNIPKQGYYSRMHLGDDDKKFKEKDMYTTEFWLPIFKDTDFSEYLEKAYTFNNIFDMIESEDELTDITTEEIAVPKKSTKKGK